MNVRYAFNAQEVHPSDGTSEGYFYFSSGDGTEVRITKGTLAQWIADGGLDNAKSQFFATLNLAFSANQSEGYAYVQIGPDGEPLDYYQQTTPEE